MARSTIAFNDAADAQLEGLVTDLGASSKAEVVRNALSLYAYIVQLLQQPGKALGVVNEAKGNEVEKVIVVPGMSHMPARQRKAEPAYR